MLHGANWSLGGHYLTLSYAVQGPATTDGTGFIDKIKKLEHKNRRQSNIPRLYGYSGSLSETQL